MPKKKQRHPKAKQFGKIYSELFKTINELKDGKITTAEANKRAKAVKEKTKKHEQEVRVLKKVKKL